MKKLMFLLAVLPLFAFPQFKLPDPPDRGDILIIRNLRSERIVKLVRGREVTIVTRTGKIFSDRISRIQRDTVFFADQWVTTDDFDTVRMRIDPRTPRNKKAIVFIGDSPEYSISAISSRSRAEISREAREAKKENRNYRDSLYTPLVKKNILKYNVTKLFHAEMAFSYERKIDERLTWETEISGIISANGMPKAPNDYPVYGYDGFSVTTNPKAFLFSKRTYLSSVLMYRYLQFEDEITGWPGSEHILQDQYRNDLGFSFRFGRMNRFGPVIIEVYAGAGVKLVFLRQLAYGHTLYEDGGGGIVYYNADHSPEVKNYTLFEPVINAGLKIGMCW